MNSIAYGAPTPADAGAARPLASRARRTRVVHFTSGHTMPDIRVFDKECRALAEAGYDVTVVARHPQDEFINGVQIVAVKLSSTPRMLTRITTVVRKIYREALSLNADVYHFHDPELLLAGLLLKLHGHKVIYDAHEAFRRKMLCKQWIPRPLRRALAFLFASVEGCLCRVFDHVIAADRTAAQGLGSRVTVVANYPIIADVPPRVETQHRPHPHVLIYAGGIEPDRGADVMMDVADLLGDHVELRLLGWLHDPDCERRARSMKNVKYLGFRSITGLYHEMLQADLGLMLFQPVPAYLYASENTNKLFEYMLCSLPVIASNFTGVKALIEGKKCGICVDPTDASAIAQEIIRLLDDAQLRAQMGRNGRNAILRDYNWDNERRKLLAVYEKITGGPLLASEAAPLRRGDLVRVKTWKEIASTLDEHDQLEELPFMPEMQRYCGQQFRVASRAEKTCDSHKFGLRHLPASVHLEGIRCDGSAHGGCQAGCTLFWKESWLERVPENSGPRLVEVSPSDNATGVSVENDSDAPASATAPENADTVYVCQATQLDRASTSLKPWSLSHYLRDIRCGNVRLKELLLLVPWGLQYFYWFSSRFVLRLMRKKTVRTPSANLNLQPGDSVRVRSRREIIQTLNRRGENRGLAFSAEMLLYAKKTFQVEARIEKIIDPLTGRLRLLQTPCVVLRGISCRGHCHFCPRALWHYWHEVWLEPIQPS